MLGMARPLLRDPLSRHMPFAAVAVVGQLSALWPPGPTNVGAFRISTAFLLVSAFLGIRRPGKPAHTWLVRAAVYVISVSFLMLATGGFSSGLGGLFLLPVVGIALYGEAWESGVVVGFVLVAMFGVDWASGSHEGELVRRLFLFGCLAAMISLSIHVLRRRLEHSNERLGRLLEQEKQVNAASRQLARLSDPESITSLGVDVAARLTFLPGVETQRTCYFAVDGDAITVQDPHETGTRQFGDGWILDELPALREVLTTLQPLAVALPLEEIGPTIRPAVAEAGITHGAFVPVSPDGTLHGVLAVGACGAPVPEECVERLAALAHILELALSNWAAHERLKDQATAEERRRIARELHDGLAHELAFIVSKTRRACRGTPGPGVNVRQLAGAADRALDEARRAITVLSVAQPQSLDDAVAQTAEDLGARLGMAVHLDLTEHVEVPGEVTENVLRVVREALTNAAVHGRSDNVTVRLARDERFRLEIQDDGCGFDPAKVAEGDGFGLLSMRERAASIEAELQIESAPGAGTRVSVLFG